MKMCPNLAFPYLQHSLVSNLQQTNKNQQHHLAFNKSSNFPLSHEQQKLLLSIKLCWLLNRDPTYTAMV